MTYWTGVLHGALLVLTVTVVPWVLARVRTRRWKV
jgi:hypothetical protein